MATVQLTMNLTAGGVAASGSMSRTVTSGIGHNPDLPAGQAGTVTTRTDNDTAVITLDSSAVPTVTTSDKVTVFWTGGVRYNMTVTAVSGSTISIDAGAGDNLPVLTTAVVVAEDVRVDTDFDGDEVKAFCVSCPQQARIHVRFDGYVGTDNTPIFALDLPAGECIGWASSGIFANPLLAVNVGAIAMANGSTAPVTGAVAIGYDGTI